MKTPLLFAFLFAFSSVGFGQVTSPPDTSKKNFNNVIGVDLAALIILVSNGEGSSYLNQPYMLTYRHFFKSNGIRIGIGGNFDKSASENSDSTTTDSERYLVNAGIGYERYVYLSRRWNFYFGADAIFRFEHRSSYDQWNPTSSRNERWEGFGFGVSPVLGIQFKVSQRISLATETSYDVLYYKRMTERYSKPNSIYDTKSDYWSLKTTYYPPTTVSLRVHF